MWSFVTAKEGDNRNAEDETEFFLTPQDSRLLRASSGGAARSEPSLARGRAAYREHAAASA